MEKQLQTVWYEFSTPLKRFIQKRVGDEQSAEDILQDVFVKVHSHLDSLQDEHKLESWLYQITRNAITDFYRRRRDVHPLTDDLPIAAADEDAELRNALATSVRHMLDGLPEEYRTPLLLDVMDGVPQAEIGARLGLSLPATKSRVQRARAKLREMLFECCHFEFDRVGRVIDYYPRAQCCPQCECAPNSATA